MEQTSNSSLFSLTIDPVTKAHLSEAARWARFLAIIGFVFLALMVVGGIFLSTMMAQNMSQLDGGYGGSANVFASMGAGLAVLYIIMAVIMFFPLLFLLRFANRTKAALASNDQQVLNTSFQNLKAYFRYIGIITIIILAFYAIAIVFGVLGAAAFS